MSEYAEKIRGIAKKLLDDGTVDMVIGFRKGTMPLINEPCFVKDAAKVDALVWDSSCGVNLANYLPKRKEKIGVVAKGCDSRNIVTHIVENQITREQLYIIGVPCTGMVDRRKIRLAVGKEILSVSEADGKITVTGDGYEEVLDKQEMLQDNCAICIHRNPVISDEVIADPVEEQTDVDRYADVKAVEAMDPEARWNHFEQLLDGCIRCYACRNACPLCYCPTCFVDESQPQWVGKSVDKTDTRTFHFLRAYHCAGRCTDCGACERACPVGIPVRQFTKKLEKDCKELFDWEAGMSLDVRPPLDTYRPEDPDEFIK
ncbi:4Fe-4S dicluster domain-containing protein [Desulfatibacillum alkenivorans DSM 16219]|jgi:coenzyme F420-reducing hydrogenase beta subunit|uniref:4Fe-4S dicluster domain-containing protein n=1 Tax=Desulfatibacillum alkenivorans DSM 16219 TaxID=1121393 RepID=A0A1M6QJQ9_9BACT|nr:4Fe-4S dicluster domain-containing protein [Desulfatibacillum alkenivorans]SHK20405.1 4Fe-4S dicluster domain-containing protein [Desulfatibacillum alkenivorans DSM 16219]